MPGKVTVEKRLKRARASPELAAFRRPKFSGVAPDVTIVA